MPVPTANKAPSFLMLFVLDLREFRTTDGEHGTNHARKCFKMQCFGQRSGIVILLTSTTVKVKIAFLRLLEEVSLC